MEGSQWFIALGYLPDDGADFFIEEFRIIVESSPLKTKLVMLLSKYNYGNSFEPKPHYRLMNKSNSLTRRLINVLPSSVFECERLASPLPTRFYTYIFIPNEIRLRWIGYR